MAWYNRTKKHPPHRYAAHQVAVPVVVESMKQLSAKLDNWQARVLSYAEIIPEVMTGFLFVHNTMDMVTFEVERFDRFANEWVTDESPAIQGINRRLNFGFKAGRTAAVMSLVEEAYVLVTRVGNSELAFESLAPTEIKSQGAVVQKRVLTDGEKVEWVPIPAATTIIRIFTPDPADRDKASGPHKPLLNLLETMALELSRDQADAISVLAGNGILYVPTEILPDEVDSIDASDTPGSRKGFENALEEAMIATISDRARGDAIVPITLYGPAEYADSIRHILPTSISNSESDAKMRAYIERYARSIDLPAQVILGIGDSNHWSDWKVDENTWAYHLYPRAQRIADALYVGVVKQILLNLGLDPIDYRLSPDATPAIAKSDMSRAAVDAYKMGALTPEAFIEAVGFDPSDMRPDADETLLAILHAAPTADTTTPNDTLPQRTAASKNPAVILRQATKIANQHQQRLEAIFKKYLGKVAADAARDGKKAKAHVAKEAKTAAAEVPFLGYQPGVYFTKYAAEMEAATNDELFAFLRRIATLVGVDYKLLRTVWSNEFQHRAVAVAKEAKIASETIGQRSFKTGKPMKVADNIIRAMSSTANGGTNQTNGVAGNTNHPTHAGTDPVMKEALTAAVGSYVTQYTWIWGGAQHPFPPHEELNGTTWLSWQEFDTLDVADSDSWLPGSVYFPGDHDGCTCEYEIDFIPQSEVPE